MPNAKHKQSIELLGIYRYVPDRETLRQQATISDEDTPARKLAQARRELSAVVLVEVLAHHTRRSFKARFGQAPRGMNAFAWGLRQLTLDGVELTPYDITAKEIVRLAFFLHDYNPRKPIRSEAGLLPRLPMQPMPTRLAIAMPYDVCD